MGGKGLQAVLPAIAAGMAWISGAIFLLLSFYITIDTIGRSFGWFYSGLTEGVTSYALAIAGSFGIAYALYTNRHVRIDLLLPMFPPKLRFFLDILAIVLAGLFTALLAYHTFELGMRSWRLGTKSISTLQAPLFVPQLALAWALFFCALIAFQMTVMRLVSALRSGDYAAVTDESDRPDGGEL